MQPELALAVDLGGTKIAVAVVDSSGAVVRKARLPIDKQATLAQITSAARQVADATGVSWGRIRAVGVVVPGIYFAASGDAWAPNLFGPDPVPLRGQLQAGLPAPVVLDSDRAAYVLGEQWLGAAQGLSDVVFLAVGTGIGAGILSGGRLVRGAGDIAGAVGWFALNPRRQPLYEQMGCWETEAAGPAVARRATERLARGEPSSLSSGEITTEAVVAAARRGDALAASVLEDVARYLAMGIANIISLLNPEMVVLGGGLMQAGDLLLPLIRRQVPEWAQPFSARAVKIELTRLGEDAGLLGAARLAFSDKLLR
ncbi:MAG TPA: ROK family protein [Bryobacteraceae bacterium]|nr:ROK family protein [Bryobacteraceae bacterium]